VPGLYHGAYGLATGTSAVGEHFRERSVEAVRAALLDD
jgi:hypothetical protein